MNLKQKKKIQIEPLLVHGVGTYALRKDYAFRKSTNHVSFQLKWGAGPPNISKLFYYISCTKRVYSKRGSIHITIHK